MPAYMILIREEPVRDEAAMAEYQKFNRKNVDKFPTLKPLAVYGAMEQVEGELPDGALILEFPSVEDAKAWYNSPEYQEALPYRLKAADYRAFIIEGLNR